MRKIAVSVAALLLCASSVLAQVKVTGTVVDSYGPVVGATVLIKGTSTGAVTDLEGNFSLNVDDPKNAVLIVRYVGMNEVQQELNGKTSGIEIKMTESADQLDEVVVIGYGTQKKVNLTGAVTAITGEKITKRPVTNTTTMLQGQVPGLRIVQGTGQPGAESVSVKIRGVGTFSGAGASPLVLINGVTGDLSSVDPNMIESVSVLKDAASAAIYGARAANGVILITTKQGADKGEKVSITYRGNFAVHTPTKMFDLVTNSAD